jgi:hypothetical protein
LTSSSITRRRDLGDENGWRAKKLNLPAFAYIETGANYTDSGGAIVALCRDERHRRAVAQALAAPGRGVVCVDHAPGYQPLEPP